MTSKVSLFLAVVSVVAVVAVTGFFQAHVISVTQRIIHVARGVFFIQSSFNQSKSEISRDHFEFFSHSIVINLFQQGEAQEKA